MNKAAAIAGIELLEIGFLEPGERAKIYIKAYDADREYVEEPGELQVKIAAGDASVLQVEDEAVIGVRAGRSVVDVWVKLPQGQQFYKSLNVQVIEQASKQYSNLSNVAERPRIMLTKEECGLLRSRVSQPSDSALRIDVGAIWAELKEEGDRFRDESGFTVSYGNASDVIPIAYPLVQLAPRPEPSGYIDYPFWTMYSRGIEHRLVTLSLMYVLTNETGYADKAKSMLLELSAYHRWYEFSHRGAEGNLSNAHFTIGAATAYDMLHSYLNEAERLAVRTAILEKGLRPMSIDFGKDDQHNIVVAKHVAMMIGALSILEEEPVAAKYVEQTYHYMKTYLDRRVEAEETEGLMYNNVAARHLAQAAAAYKKTTGDASLIEHPFLTVFLPEQFFYFQSAGYQPTFANLSDSHPKLDLSHMMSMFAEFASNGAAMWYIQQYEANKQSVLLNVIKGTEAVPPEQYFAGKLSKVFPRIGWAALRSGWGMEDHLVAFTSSPSCRDHNHFDQNHFIMNVGGEWLITDPGYQDYRPGPKHEVTVGSVGHNVLLVNGQGQVKRGGGTIVQSHTSPSFDAVRGDATASYDGALKGWHRTVVHAASKYIVVIDEIELNNAEHCAELLLHTTAEIQPVESEQGAYTIRGEQAAIYVKAASTSGFNAKITQYEGAEEYGQYAVYQLRSDEAGRARMITLLEPNAAAADKGKPKLDWKVEWQEDTAIVTVGESDLLRAAALTDGGAIEWQRRAAADEPAIYAMFSGKSLQADGNMRMTFSQPASATVELYKQACCIAITLIDACQVRIAIPGAIAVYDAVSKAVLGTVLDTSNEIIVDLPAGEHRLKTDMAL
ncbi:heparinase II/III domain-containing protein [Paenibacillus sp. GXUN7292]|uniref:heparinase II/III family protein n=1 Tax=Paenibacillus sp. GXUN7292 TaxID=3422499 RepID=UPI003D7DA90E